MSLWIIFVSSSLIFVSSISIAFYIEFIENKRKNNPIKDTIIARLDLFNRKFFIEKIQTKDKKIIKNINFNKWNKISLITNSFNLEISKKFAEILNNLDKGSIKEEFYFEALSFYTKKKSAKYHFYFNKIEDSTDYLFKLDFNHITKDNNDHIINKIQKITKKEIIENKKLIKGFVAFNIKKNIDYSIERFLQLINCKKETRHIFYIKHNAMLVFVVLKNKKTQVKKIISKIKDQAQSTYFSNELKYLYNGSSIAISKKVNSIKNINQILQTLSFLVINSIKNNSQFLSANVDINHKEFKTYNQTLRIFNQTIKNGSFKINITNVRNIGDNQKVVEYIFPHVSNINDALFNWLNSDINNQIELSNAFAEKILFRASDNPIMIDVNDMWLINNIDKIKNKKALIVINFRNLIKNTNKINLIKEVNKRKIAFAFYVKHYDNNVISILQTTKPHFILIDDNIWLENKLLSYNHFVKLIALKSLSVKNKIKMIYKNPSLILDKKTYEDIGLKYYFEK